MLVITPIHQPLPSSAETTSVREPHEGHVTAITQTLFSGCWFFSGLWRSWSRVGLGVYSVVVQRSSVQWGRKHLVHTGEQEQPHRRSAGHPLAGTRPFLPYFDLRSQLQEGGQDDCHTSTCTIPLPPVDTPVPYLQGVATNVKSKRREVTTLGSEKHPQATD